MKKCKALSIYRSNRIRQGLTCQPKLNAKSDGRTGKKKQRPADIPNQSCMCPKLPTHHHPGKK